MVTLYQGVQFQEQEWEARREKQGRTQNRRHIINLGIGKCGGLLSPLWRKPSGTIRGVVTGPEEGLLSPLLRGVSCVCTDDPPLLGVHVPV